MKIQRVCTVGGTVLELTDKDLLPASQVTMSRTCSTAAPKRCHWPSPSQLVALEQAPARQGRRGDTGVARGGCFRP